MAAKIIKVFLEYEVSKDRYHLVRIQGHVPVIEIMDKQGEKVGDVRVGSILNERQVFRLGFAADLTIKRYTV